MARSSLAGRQMLYCSFCGKSQDEVLVILAGPTVFICSECVEVCVRALADWKTEAVSGGDSPDLEAVNGRLA